MKSVLVLSTYMFFVMNMSAQEFAKKKQYKNSEPINITTNKDFKSYVTNVNSQLEGVNTSLKQLEFYTLYQTQLKKKFDSKIHSLEKESAELNTDLNNFIHYGIGDWKLFKNEFNEDLALLVNDVQVMESKLEPGDLIVQK